LPGTTRAFPPGALAALACWALLPPAGHADGTPAAKPAFTPEEVRVILSHGPFPAPVPYDPTNRASGNRAAVEFGTKLFFDTRLSGDGTTSCATCHVPERNWSDNQRRGMGLAEMDRKTPTLWNLLGQRWFGWDGAADSLWFQSLRPILGPRELAATPRHVAGLVRNDPLLSCRYRNAFGEPPSSSDDEAVLVDVGKSLAAFIETLMSGATPFDRFRDALARGAPPSAWNSSEPAQRGLKLFIGKGGCTACHAGPNFNGGGFFSTGLSKFAPRGRPDPGRPAGIRELLASRYNLLGPYNDDRTGAAAARTREAALEQARFGTFKVPTLRNLVLNMPYGRDGSVDTIAEVVRHYAGLDPARLRAGEGHPGEPLNLTPQEQTDLVVFLESLTSFSNPWRPESSDQCH
jgi:cytochrome c peroxidase